MKKAIVIGMALVLVLFLMTSCGVSQQEYDKVGSDLTTAQTQIQLLQGELSAKETELSAKESELKVTKEKLKQGKARFEILNAIFMPALTGEIEGMTEAEALIYFFEWRDKIIDVEDPTLIVKFEVMIETLSAETWLSFYEASLSFFVYLLESTADVLE